MSYGVSHTGRARVDPSVVPGSIRRGHRECDLASRFRTLRDVLVLPRDLLMVEYARNAVREGRLECLLPPSRCCESMAKNGAVALGYSSSNRSTSLEDTADKYGDVSDTLRSHQEGQQDERDSYA